MLFNLNVIHTYSPLLCQRDLGDIVITPLYPLIWNKNSNHVLNCEAE